jgi:hypothetical protein
MVTKSNKMLLGDQLHQLGADVVLETFSIAITGNNDEWRQQGSLKCWISVQSIIAGHPVRLHYCFNSRCYVASNQMGRTS